MVSALHSGLSSPNLSSGLGTMLCSWARIFAPIVSCLTQLFKWLPTNLMLGYDPSRAQAAQALYQITFNVTLAYNTPSCLMPRKLGG